MAREPVQYLSNQTIARLLERSESWVRKEQNAGRLRFEMHGGQRRVARPEYDAWLDALRAPKR